MIKEGYIAQWNNYPEDEVKIRVARPSILGPSKKLLQDYKENDLSWAEYTTRYVAEIMASPRALRQIEDIIELSKTKTVRLICYEKNPPCHRFILMDMITDIIEGVLEMKQSSKSDKIIANMCPYCRGPREVGPFYLYCRACRKHTKIQTKLTRFFQG